ncbi:MAG: hypothetical protein M0Z49_04185 [Chloroflexi bacterium]|nr:hypothetical protein [Chloroflexota bacterium]
MSERRDAWSEVEALLIDGNNLLHAVAGDAGPAALRGLLPRLVAAVPSSVDTVVVLDGTPDPGAPSWTRLRHGLVVRHAGRRSADAVLVDLVEARPFDRRALTVVITNDVGLAQGVRRAGGRVRPVAWLARQFATGAAALPAGGSVGWRRPPMPLPGDGGERDGRDDEAARPAWSPGRGATRKRGNPRRGR